MNRATLEEIRALGGDLKARPAGPACQYGCGGRAGVARGVNAIVDTLTAPLALAIEQVARLSRGEIPERLTVTCRASLRGCRKD